jgi:hypothetical protein
LYNGSRCFGTGSLGTGHSLAFSGYTNDFIQAYFRLRLGLGPVGCRLCSLGSRLFGRQLRFYNRFSFSYISLNPAWLTPYRGCRRLL